LLLLGTLHTAAGPAGVAVPRAGVGAAGATARHRQRRSTKRIGVAPFEVDEEDWQIRYSRQMGKILDQDMPRVQ
ncbi:hypothetical protein HispidOSU_020364, partial [Sigmodon hispidus]